MKGKTQKRATAVPVADKLDTIYSVCSDEEAADLSERGDKNNKKENNSSSSNNNNNKSNNSNSMKDITNNSDADANTITNKDEPSGNTYIFSNLPSLDGRTANSGHARKRWAVSFVYFCVCVLIVTLVSLVVLAILQRKEFKRFETQYNQAASDLLSAVEERSENVQQTLVKTSGAFTLQALSSKSEFPYFSLNDFDVLSEYRTAQVFYSPFVSSAEYDNWEEYSDQTIDEITEDLDTFEKARLSNTISSKIWGDDQNMSHDHPIYAPIWQNSPQIIDPLKFNYDIMSNEVLYKMYDEVKGTQDLVVKSVQQLPQVFRSPEEFPSTMFMYPIFKQFRKDLNDRQEIVGVLIAVLPWTAYFTEPNNVYVTTVLRDSCGQDMTFQNRYREMAFVALGDLHDPSNVAYEYQDDVSLFAYTQGEESCTLSVHVYPTKRARERLHFSPLIISEVLLASCALSIICMALACKYRHRNLNQTPSVCKDQDDGYDVEKQAVQIPKASSKAVSCTSPNPAAEVDSYGPDDSTNMEFELGDGRSADATVLSADIINLTEWSHSRHPDHEYTLIQALHSAFDAIARSNHITVVETTSNGYVAVAGLSRLRNEHAEDMACFAWECLIASKVVLRKLEETLGGTKRLQMRFGIHSGAVTAGQLRVDASRIHLFGNTVNMASVLKKYCEPNKIHMSVETASLLLAAERGYWLEDRTDPIQLDEAGEHQTYWLNLSPPATVKSLPRDTVDIEFAVKYDNNDTTLKKFAENIMSNIESEATKLLTEQNEHVQWFTAKLEQLLKLMAADRNRRMVVRKPLAKVEKNFVTGPSLLQEVTDVLQLSDEEENRSETSNGTYSDYKKYETDLDKETKYQVKAYIRAIACLYRRNSYHTFQQACATAKVMVTLFEQLKGKCNTATEKHEQLEDIEPGQDVIDITEDPFVQFACIFSCLIRGVDHRGLPNNCLAVTEHALRSVYGDVSISEQNAVDMAWNLLMDRDYRDLRAAIYCSEKQLKRFRQIIVNCVLVCDRDNKELDSRRRDLWNKAYSGKNKETLTKKHIDRKATMVVEHLMLVSDNHHAIGSWTTFLEKTMLLYYESFDAYQKTDNTKSPAHTWYDEQVDFFDCFAIPSAMKLRACGILGKLSDDYVENALTNRRNWATYGEDVVRIMVSQCDETSNS